MDEPCKRYAGGKASLKRPHIVWLHLCGMSSRGKSVQTGFRLVVVTSWGKGNLEWPTGLGVYGRQPNGVVSHISVSLSLPLSLKSMENISSGEEYVHVCENPEWMIGETEDDKKNSLSGVLGSLGFSQIIYIYCKEKLSINNSIDKNTHCLPS